MAKVLHPEQPLLCSPNFQFDKMAEDQGPLKFDGSRDDYWTYLRRLEKGFANFGLDMAVKIGPDTHIKIPPIYTQFINARYWVRQNPKAPYYVLNAEVRDALLNTDLTWIDAEAFNALPDVLGIIVSPTHDDLSLFHHSEEGDWHSISDMMLFRVKDPEHLARIAIHHGLPSDDPSIQFFYWAAFSREGWDKGKGGINWGTFPITANVKLEDLAKDLDAYTRRIAARELALGDSVHWKTNDPEMEAFVEENNIIHADYRKDLEMVDQQSLSFNRCVEFIAKFALLHSCDWFKGRCVPLNPPGLKAMPHKAPALWRQWGHRYMVVPPPREHSEETDEGSKRTRHFVRGFFRQQPYGPQHGLRRTQWIMAHWRGQVF